MNQEAKKEILKCKQSPYYFATKYLTVNGKPFTTMLSEESFNEMFHRLSELKPYIKQGIKR